MKKLTLLLLLISSFAQAQLVTTPTADSVRIGKADGTTGVALFGDVYFKNATQGLMGINASKKIIPYTLTTSDIPSLPISKVADLQASLDSKLQYLADISALTSYVRGSNTLAVVKDPVRGGVFSYVSSGLTVDNGIVFAAAGGGYWVRQHYKNVIYSSWWDIDTTGVTDAATKLKAIIDIAASGSSKLIINPGTYKLDPVVFETAEGIAADYGDPSTGHISDSIAIWIDGVTNLEIECIGDVNFLSSKTPVFIYRGNNVKWTGGKFTYTGNWYVNGPTIYRSIRSGFDRVESSGYYRGILLMKGIDTYVQNSKSTNSRYFNFYAEGRIDIVVDPDIEVDTIGQSYSNRMYLRNNVAANGAYGNYLLGRVDAVENQSYNLPATGLAHFYSQQGYSNIIRNVIVDTLNMNSVATNIGIAMVPTDVWPNVYKSVVSGNLIKGTRIGILAEGQGLVIENNTVQDWWEQGIQIQSTAGTDSRTKNIIVSKNMISDINANSTIVAVSPKVIAGISVIEAVGRPLVSNIQVINNTLAVSSALKYNLYVTDSDSLTLFGNTYEGSGMVIVNGVSVQNRIQGNTRFDNRVAIGGDTFNETLNLSSAGINGASGPSIGMYSTNGNSGVRNWAFINSWSTYGELMLRVSTAKGGDPSTAGSNVLSLKANSADFLVPVTLPNGSVAITQSPGDNSTKPATTAYADEAATASAAGKANINGSNATGTWPIGVSGNAASSNNSTQWSGWTLDQSNVYSTAPTGVFGYTSGSAIQKIFDPTALGLFIGLSDYVKTSTNQTIGGIKTFSSSPIVPTPSGSTDAANKDYVDANSSGRVLEDWYTSASNSGTTETDLLTYSVPGNTLVSNGDKLSFVISGNYSLTGNSKTLSVYYGSSEVEFPASTAAGSSWRIEGVIIKTGATSFVISTTRIESSATIPGVYSLTGTVTNHTAANNFKIIGQGGASSDITANFGTLEFKPAAP